MSNDGPQPIQKDNREQKQNRPSEQQKTEIEIMGMACRFPGARNYQNFWEDIEQGQPGGQGNPQTTNNLPDSIDMAGQTVENCIKTIIVEELSNH